MKLPNKPSSLLRLAIHDLELCEKDSRYVIDMANYHYPSARKCYVCLAGSVMAKTLEVPYDQLTGTTTLVEGYKLRALNDLRVGWINLGLQRLGFPRKKIDIFGPDLGRAVPYSNDPSLFKQQMLDLADIFEVEGM